MDNKMINIDELFQQRMGNAEEAQRPGSWLKMRELLDEQMPVDKKPIAGGNWRRMLYVTAGLLLLSTITVGSYQAVTAFRDNGVSDDVKAKYAAYNPTAGAATSVINYADKSSNAQNDFNTASNDQNDRSNTPNNNDDNNVNAIATSSSATNGNNSPNYHPTKTETNGNKTQHKTVTKNTNKLLNTNTLPNTSNSKTLTESNVSTNNKVDAQMQPVIDNIADIYNSNPNKTANTANSNSTTVTNNVANETPNNINTSNGINSNQADKNNTLALNAPTNNNPKNTQVAKNTKPNNKNNSTVTTDTKIDSIKKIELSQSITAKGIVKTDTIGVDKVPVERKKDLIASNQPASDKTMPDKIVVPNAAALTMTTEDGQGVYKPLAKADEPETKAKKNYYSANRFDEMVRNAKLKMNGVKFYPGIVAGANMSMSKKGLTGFQLGMKGDLAFGNRWSMLSEIKYMQRFNGSKDLRDDYNTGLDSFVQNGNKIYTYDSVEHYFNFTTISTIEMPIAIKYNLNRFNVFGGVNLNYNFGINADEVDRPYRVTKEVGTSSGTLNYGLLSGKPTITASDFSSRFSVGYLFGMSYELSPAMQLDLRLTQSMWDNAKSSGAKAISKDVYNAPTIQFNMSYRFKQKPYKKFRN